MTKSIQFEIISRGSILQNYSHEPDIFSELQKCDNSKIKQFVNEYQNNGFNYKKDPNHIVTVIKEEFPETIEYYKIQLFLSQLYKDIADGISNEDRKRIYEFSSKKYLKKSKKTEKICVNTIHVSNQIEDIHENTDEKIIECENYYHKYEDPNFLLTKGNLESINNTEEAIKTFKEGTQKFEDDKRFNNNLANMYMSIEEFYTAEKYYKEIDEIVTTNIGLIFNSPSSAQQIEIFWNNIGCMYSQINDIQKAEFYFNKAIRQNSQNYQPWYNSGIQKMITGDRAGAEKNLRKSYNLNKDHHLTGINYAQALIKNNNIGKARSIFKKLSSNSTIPVKEYEEVRSRLENNSNYEPELPEPELPEPEFKNESFFEIKEKILEIITRSMEREQERDGQLFQRIVTAMQENDKTAARTLSNELAEIRKITKLMSDNWATLFKLTVNKPDLKNKELFLRLCSKIRDIATVQKLMGQKLAYNSLVILHNKLIQIHQKEFSIPSDEQLAKMEYDIDSNELIKIANDKLKLNDKDIHALELIIFAYFELDDISNVSKYTKKLSKIVPEDKYSFLTKIGLNKKIKLDNESIDKKIRELGRTDILEKILPNSEIMNYFDNNISAENLTIKEQNELKRINKKIERGKMRTL